MSWIKQIPDDELLALASEVLVRCASAVQEFRAAKLAWNAEISAAQVRLDEARNWLRESRDTYEAIAAELKGRATRVSSTPQTRTE